MPKKQNKKKQSATKLKEAPALKKVAPDQKPADTEDHEYALVSVLYHALQGVQACEQYMKDAERADDDELVAFFEETRDEQAGRANRAKALLGPRMETSDDSDDDDDDDDDDEDEDDSEGDKD